MNDWPDFTPITDERPPERELVECIAPSGTLRFLKRIGNLYFVPSGEMYVYFTPVYWRELRSPPGNDQ